MALEQDVARHYQHGALEKAILDALQSAGKDIDRLGHTDLAAIDEFHVGGRQATMELGTVIGLPRGARVLDVGSGIGGPSRFFAAEHGWQVDGIDLTPEYVEVAAALSHRVGLDAAVRYHQASATALPFPDATYDGAYMLHVGMNIADKRAVFSEVRRILKPRGVFAIYDIMRQADGAFDYPVPWSSAPETNFIDTADAYKRLLAETGFTVERERSRRDFAIDFFQQMQRRMATGGPATPGLPILMGPTAAQKVANMRAMIERGTIAPVEIVSRVA